MKFSELLWTFGLAVAGIVGFNMLIRTIRHGFDATLNFSLPGLAIAAVIALIITIAQADHRRKNAHGQS